MTEQHRSIPVYKPDLVASLYRPMRQGDWELRRGGTVLTRGYWSPPQLVHDIVSLVRCGETWMSITPMEIESQETGIAHASGHVVVFGLGLGWSAAASALRPDVDRVTVVERDRDIIALHEALGLFSRLPDQAGDKVQVLEGNAFEWKPEEPVDRLLVDIWLPLVSDDRVEEVRRMQRHVVARSVYFWGQEMEIARHARAKGHALDDTGIAAVIASFNLPLVGPGVGYAERVNRSATAWMRDRWLS